MGEKLLRHPLYFISSPRFVSGLIAVLVVAGVLVTLAHERYSYLRHEYNTDSLRLDIVWDREPTPREYRTVYWQGIRGDVVASDYLSAIPGGVRHESSLYHRGLWVDARVVSDIALIRLCIAERCRTIEPEDLRGFAREEISYNSRQAATVEAVRIEAGDLARGSRIPYFDGIVNWRGDLYLLAFDLAAVGLQLASLGALVLLLLFVLRSPGGDIREPISGDRRTIWILLAAIFLTALVVRFWGIGNLDPHVDEYTHVSTALGLSRGAWPDYTRGIIVTIAMAAAYTLSGASSFTELITVGAIPGVLAGALAVLPLYALGRRVSPITGLVAALLWALSPWAIGMAHSMREYAYFPLLILIFVLSIVRIFELLVLQSRFRTRVFVLWALLFAAFSCYAFFVDTASTLRAGFLFGGLTALGLVVGYWGRIYSRLRRQPKLLALAVIPLAVLAYIVFSLATGDSQVSAIPQSPDWWWAHALFAGGYPLQSWNGPSLFFWPVVFALLPAFVLALRARSVHVGTWLLTFAGVLAFYVFFFDRYTNSRYMFYILPFVCLLAAATLHAIWSFAVAWPVERSRIVLLLCAAAFT